MREPALTPVVTWSLCSRPGLPLSPVAPKRQAKNAAMAAVSSEKAHRSVILPFRTR
jgi:hypothetical protein